MDQFSVRIQILFQEVIKKALDLDLDQQPWKKGIY